MRLDSPSQIHYLHGRISPLFSCSLIVAVVRGSLHHDVNEVVLAFSLLIAPYHCCTTIWPSPRRSISPESAFPPAFARSLELFVEH